MIWDWIGGGWQQEAQSRDRRRASGQCWSGSGTVPNNGWGQDEGRDGASRVPWVSDKVRVGSVLTTRRKDGLRYGHLDESGGLARG